MRVVIHADASPAIGTGHVVRCLALAAALRERSAEVVLASDELVESLARYATSLGVDVVARGDAPRDPDWIVVDGYHLDAKVRRALADAEVPRLILDDFGGDVAGEIVLNQNLYASPAGPTRATSGELLAGPAFALLRPEFGDVTPERAQPPVATRLLVTMGGSDPHDATSVVVRSIGELRPTPEVRVVLGAAHPTPDAVRRQAGAFDVLGDVPTLMPHLAWADIAVSACGTTVLEAIRVGRPIAGVVLADNQVAVARALEREGLGRVAGRHPSLDAAVLRAHIAALRDDPGTRAEIAARGPEIVDGRGARRVARVLATGPLRLRAASMSDADLLLAWRNDPVTRAGSFDTSLVERRAHLAWLSERVGSDLDRVWIGILGGRPAGVIRFALEGDRATASVTVAPDRRGSGVATRLIASGCARLAAESSVRAIDAWIRPENAASVAAFRSAGFRPADGEADRLRLELPLTSVP